MSLLRFQHTNPQSTSRIVNILRRLQHRTIDTVPEMLRQQHPAAEATVPGVVEQGGEVVGDLAGQLGGDVIAGVALRVVEPHVLERVPAVLEPVGEVEGVVGKQLLGIRAERVRRPQLAVRQLFCAAWQAGERLRVAPHRRRVPEQRERYHPAGRVVGEVAQALAGAEGTLAVKVQGACEKNSSPPLAIDVNLSSTHLHPEMTTFVSGRADTSCCTLLARPSAQLSDPPSTMYPAMSAG